MLLQPNDLNYNIVLMVRMQFDRFIDVLINRGVGELNMWRKGDFAGRDA